MSDSLLLVCAVVRCRKGMGYNKLRAKHASIISI
jgi:ribosomal protein L40E